MMTETTKTPAVYRAICAVTRDMSSEGIGKNRMNEQQRFKFRGIDDVHNALSPVLALHGLAMLPRVMERTMMEGVTKNGSPNYTVTVRVEFDLVAAEDGSKHTICTYGEAMDMADKATNKAMSAAYKYAAIQAFCIPVEGQDDADAHTPEPAARNAPRQPDRPPARQPDTRPAPRQEPAAQPAPTPAAQAERPAPTDPLATLAALGWDRLALGCLDIDPKNTDATSALIARARGGWRPDNKEAAKADDALHLVTRRLSRVREAKAAGILTPIVEENGKPSTWDHKKCDALKASIAAAGGAA